MKNVIGFLKYRSIAYIVSFVMLVGFTVVTVMSGGLNMGIDFVGGNKIIAKFDSSVNEKAIRDVLSNYNPTVQKIGANEKNEYIISTKLLSEKQKSLHKQKDGEKKLSGTDIIQIKLKEKFKSVEFLSVENVGPAIGDYLRKSAFKLFIIALVLMSFYLTFRFEFKYSIGAMAALLHDMILTVLFCGFMGVEFSIPVIAALLTIFGYSVNDSIVIFDRIRENVNYDSNTIFTETINKSITQSISRTLLTSLTTMFSVLALYFIGGEVLNDFALVLLFGIFVGTYSSIYVASPVLSGWEKLVTKK